MSSTSDAQGRFLVSPLVLLERFLLCGQMSNRVEIGRPFSEIPEAARNSVLAITQAFPAQAIELLSKVVRGGRASRQPPVLFALACALSTDSIKVRAEGLHPQAVRTGTDALVLASYLKSLKGGGRSFRRQAGLFYKTLEEGLEDRAALQFIKYRNRAGWTHRDLLRVCHHKPSDAFQEVFSFAAGKEYSGSNRLIHGFLEAQEMAADFSGKCIPKIIRLIRECGLPWEALPSEALGNVEVWEELLPNLPFTALLRNLGRMQSLGMDLSSAVERLAWPTRTHPVQMLSAYKVYGSGHGQMGSLAWRPDARVTKALENGFYASFGSLEKKTNKVIFGLDVSGSMFTNPSTVAGLNCAEAAAAMVMAAAKQQPFALFGFSHNLVDIPIDDTWSLDRILTYVRKIPFGYTKCALPITHAHSLGVSDVDLFAIYTDNETNGGPKPMSALQAYREAHNPDACFASVAFAGNAQSIVDPDDWGSSEFCGFDSSVPGLLSELAERTNLF